MTESVHVICFFDGTSPELPVQDVLSFCLDRATPLSGEQPVGARDIASRVLEDGQSVSFGYEDIAFNLRAGDRDGDLVPALPALSLRLDDIYFRPRQGVNTEEDVLAHSAQLADLVVGLYEHLAREGHPPKFVCGLGPGDVEVLGNPAFPEELTEVGVLADRYEFVSWLQILPPAMADTFDEDRLLSAPASRVERLTDGAVLLVVDTSPTMIESAYDPDAVAEHLGIE